MQPLAPAGQILACCCPRQTTRSSSMTSQARRASSTTSCCACRPRVMPAASGSRTTTSAQVRRAGAVPVGIKPHQRPDTGAATKRSRTSTSRATGLCVLIEFSDKQLILTRPEAPLDSGNPSKPTGKTLGRQGPPPRLGALLHLEGTQAAFTMAAADTIDLELYLTSQARRLPSGWLPQTLPMSMDSLYAV